MHPTLTCACVLLTSPCACSKTGTDACTWSCAQVEDRVHTWPLACAEALLWVCYASTVQRTWQHTSSQFQGVCTRSLHIPSGLDWSALMPP